MTGSARASEAWGFRTELDNPHASSCRCLWRTLHCVVVHQILYLHKVFKLEVESILGHLDHFHLGKTGLIKPDPMKRAETPIDHPHAQG
jgi:hypothetical protein